MIIARNEKTQKNILDIGIKTPIQVCPDTAFLLEVDKRKKIDDIGKNVVGISVSHVAEKKCNDGEFVNKIAQLADYIMRLLC